MFADVIVDISHEKLDKAFQYRIPKELEKDIVLGCCVEVPFGMGNRTITGYVIDISDKPCMDISKIKEIKGIKKGSLNIESQLISLAWYIKEYYGSTMNQALKTVIPIKKSVKGKDNKYIKLNVSKEIAFELYEKYRSRKNTVARANLLMALTKNDEIEYEAAKKSYTVTDSIIKALLKDNIIEITKTKVMRNPVSVKEKTDYNIILNEEQKRVVEDIFEDIKYTDENGEKKNTHLIFGVTGSGKTEVYMEIIDGFLKKGKEAIVLIPEIALTYQTIRRFVERFGNQVSIINSKLSMGEKYDQFERAKNGEVKIMIGPRSALFTPFRNLGVIIIDEEHDSAYKSDKVPKYHAREVAIRRAELSEATVILGSATPSITTYYKALKGEYSLHTLKRRANEKALPDVYVVDMREEIKNGNKDIFSDELKKLIKDRLVKKEQIILFLNRRGYSSFVSCRMCGKAIKCPHCEVTMTMHKRKKRLECHYCGFSMEIPKLCPVCGSKYIGGFGIGTEQIEEKLKEYFEGVKVLRMDMDTTRGKNDYENILNKFRNHEADILVGTQMIVKGHDFPNVTLVGVIAADLSLFSSDYMATEKTFQLLTQAAGRAGRGKTPGEVVIQTYNPDEPCIVSASKQDYEEFFDNEIGYRSLMTYPPIYGMMAILITDENEKFAEFVTNDIASRIKKSNVDGLSMIGPSKASVSKINDIYRNVIYLKHKDINDLIKVKNAINKYVSLVEKYKDISIQFDFNPINNY